MTQNPRLVLGQGTLNKEMSKTKKERQNYQLMPESTECRLQIGEFCCSLRFKDVDWAASVREYYKGFLWEKEPDLRIDLKIIPHKHWIEIPSSLILEKTVNGNQFDFHSGLLKGSLDLGNKKANIEVKYGLLKNARVFEQFLYQVYYTLLEERYPSKIPNDYLLHACAVSKDGLGYVFTGPPGSGKSTIAHLSNSYQVLNDEIVIIGKRDDAFYVRSTPFNGEFKTKVNSCVSLRAIFYLRHGKSNYLRLLKPMEFVKLAIREIIVPMPLLSEDNAKSFSKMMNYCAELASEVPCYELYFVPEKGIWEFIELSLGE